MEMNKSTWNSEKEEAFKKSLTSGLEIIDMIKSDSSVFTLTRKTVGTGPIYSWNSNSRYYPKDVRNRMGAFMDNLNSVGKKLGFDADVTTMMDQPNDKRFDSEFNPNDLNTLPIYELTSDKLEGFLNHNIYTKEGAIWNIDKPAYGMILRKEDYEKFKNETGKKAALMYPAADGAVIKVNDPENKFIGILYSGWRHASKGLPEAFITKLQNEYGTDPSKLKVYVGAMADTLLFDKIGSNIKDSEFWAKEFIEERKDGKFNLDFARVTYNELLNAGVSPENIKFSSDDVMNDNDYFTASGRKAGNPNGTDGRNAYMIEYNDMSAAALDYNLDEVKAKRI